jgi:hypothetical protein
MSSVLVKSDYSPRGGYENRSLLKEAITNRLVREFELQSIYQGPEQAAVEIMHKYQGNRNEMAWVLMGDSITKSTEVYRYIDSVVKAAGQGLQGVPSTMTGAPNAAGQPTQSHMQDLSGMMPGAEAAGMGGGASEGTAGGNQQSHPAQQAQQAQDPQAPQGGKPGLASRFGTWAKERAAPAIGRGLRHGMAGILGGMAAGPAGLVAGTGASMYQAHQAKKNPGSLLAGGQSSQKVMGGEGGLAGIAGDAAKQGGAAAGQAAQQFGQNVKQGGGVGGFLGKVGGAAKNMASSVAGGVKNAWNQAGQTQQQNAAVAGQQPPGATAPSPPMAGQPAPAAPAPPPTGGAPPAPASIPLPGAPADPAAGVAQVDPSAVNAIAQGQGGPQVVPQGAGPGMLGNAKNAAEQNMQSAGPVQTSFDNPNTYTSIEAILKGW